METSRKECLEGLRLNIKSIRSYFGERGYFQISSLYKELKDIFYLYGFTRADVEQLLEYSGNYEKFSDQELLEILGVTNAVLFHLKYK